MRISVPNSFYHRQKLVLSGKTSLKLYLALNYPSLYKPIFREEERLKVKGAVDLNVNERNEKRKL